VVFERLLQVFMTFGRVEVFKPQEVCRWYLGEGAAFVFPKAEAVDPWSTIPTCDSSGYVGISGD